MPAASSSRRPTWKQWLAELPARVRSQWRLKAVLAVTLPVLFCVPYFLIGNFPLFPVRGLPLTWLDRAVGFHPNVWVVAYQSEYVAVNLIPWLALTRRELVRYAAGFVAVSLVSFATFIFLPIRGPQPPAPDATGLYRLLIQYDVPLNAFPSLHAGLIVYTFLFGRRLYQHRLPRGLWLACVIWVGLVLYATLATKQHYLVDIVTGTMLAFLSDAWAWRRDKGFTVAPAAAPLPTEC